MANDYNPQEVEQKWQAYWDKIGLAKSKEDLAKEKYYSLVMFPYPSGEGLHVGHWRPYVISDVWTRFQKMLGKEVLYPMGWDAFGLPAENRAIKHGVHPEKSNTEAISNMKRQLMETGALFDWSREINTSDPSYYKWTQWIFLQLYKKGLAYRKEAMVNWCPKDQTVLANEQVIDGACERCGTEVIKKSLKQWFFKITDYAEELLDFSQIEWAPRVKMMQKNWIGKSEGAELFFEVEDHKEKVEVFTTRPETIFGATFLVLSPEHPLVSKITKPKYRQSVQQYQQTALKKTEIERISAEKEKTGVFTGAMVENPALHEPIPVWVADYVLPSYGTGAIMAVPAHDERDYAFAKKYELPIFQVIQTKGASLPFTEKGRLSVNGKYHGKYVEEIIDELLAELGGRKKSTYRIRDWLISRQRYWGTPIPMIYCDNCGEVPVPEDHLPVILPHEADFQPGGESPLARDPNFTNTTCPNCHQAAKRETDTMDTFVDSSWYFLRFCDPHNKERIFEPEKVKYWMPVDLYIGGIEHAILHLLYARFITKALADFGIFNFREPFKQLLDNGMIYLHGKKMSKSKGNIVNPDELVMKYGADTLRGYELFIGPVRDDVEWNPSGVAGVYRFLNKVWPLMLTVSEVSDNPSMHRLIKTVTDELEKFSFNTIVSSLMSFVNVSSAKGLSRNDKKVLAKLMAPIFPHFAEEVWNRLGEVESIFRSSWPIYEAAKLDMDTATIIVQVNGKHRGQLKLPSAVTEADVKMAVQVDLKLATYLTGKIKRTVFIPGRIINFVLE